MESKNNEELMFNKYRLKTIKHDVVTMQKVIKPKKWENIPLIGAFCYLVRIQYHTTGIVRGLFTKQLFKYQLIFLFAFLIYIYTLIILLTPWLVFWQYSISIKKTTEQLDDNAWK